MTEQPRPILGAFVGIGGPLTMYAYLKLTGQISGPGDWPWNYIDTTVMKTLHFFMYVIPIGLIIALLWFYIRFLYIEKKEEEEFGRQEQLRREVEYERQLEMQQEIRAKAIELRFSNIEKELKRLNESLLEMNKSSSEVNDTVLQNFL